MAELQRLLQAPHHHQAEVRDVRRATQRCRHKGQRGSAKTGGFARINSHIIAAADTGRLACVLETVEATLPSMNLVNLSTATHRLARMTANDTAARNALRTHPLFAGIVSSIRAKLAGVEGKDVAAQCQSLSNIAWSLATVQFPDLPLLGALATLAHRQVDSFKPYELSSLLWAFAKFDALEATVCAYALPFFESAAERIKTHMKQFTFRCLVMTAWAFATARFHDDAFFRAIGEQLLPNASSGSCQEIAQVAWAFGTANVFDESLFKALAKGALQQMGEFKGCDLACLLSGFGSCGCVGAELSSRAVEAMLTLDVEMEPPQFAEAFEALSCMRPRHMATRTAVLALLPRASTLLDAFEPQDLALVTEALTRCFGGRDGGAIEWAPAPVAEFLVAALPLQVWLRRAGGKGGAEDRFDGLGEASSNASTMYPAHFLPQPVDAIQRKLDRCHVSRQKLDEYRTDYQSFRRGSSKGAKGEVSRLTDLGQPCFISLDMLAACKPEGAEDVGTCSDGSTRVHSSSDEGVTLAHLPPPLKFLPKSISSAKLEAYRADYRRLRRGGASEARDEIWMSVQE